MIITPLPASASASATSASGFAAVVDAIGEEGFANRMGEHLREICGSVLFAAIRICGGRANLVTTVGLDRPEMALDHANRYVDGKHWLHDPALAAANANFGRHSSVMVRLDPMQVGDAVLRDEFYGPARAREKLAIYAKRGEEFFGLSVLCTRESQGFDEDAVRHITDCADLMVSVIAKHASLHAHHDVPQASPLASVATIERDLAASPWGLTPRERQVCARILFGMMAEGIGLDLGIGAESVATYRKRAYQRIGIATRHELLRTFLKLCAGEYPPRAAA